MAGEESVARAAVGVCVDELAAFDHGDGGGRDAGLLEYLRGDSVDTASKSRVDGVDGLGTEGDRSKCKDGKGGGADCSWAHGCGAVPPMPNGN